MKFGPVPLAEAEGGLLAHSVRLPGERLRKGHVLEAEDLAKLAAQNLSHVCVARPEPGDLLENEAALVLARAVHGGAEGLSLTAPFTGRVNIIADGPGLILVDAAKITAANMIDPMITIATVAQCHQIHPGGMAATIKIISYGVVGAALEAAAEAGRGALRLAAPRFATASLIVTDVSGGPGLKGQDAIKARVQGLGMDLIETLTTPHEEVALAEAIMVAKGDMVLILTASATSDIGDTAPEALRRAGGVVTRFGIPVDPGNLLFLGRHGARPVIGLPGSARSPVLHGADWILARIACGETPDDLGFAAMGVGGLLKEIPTRPQPRQRPKS